MLETTGRQMLDLAKKIGPSGKDLEHGERRLIATCLSGMLEERTNCLRAAMLIGDAPWAEQSHKDIDELSEYFLG